MANNKSIQVLRGTRDAIINNSNSQSLLDGQLLYNSTDNYLTVGGGGNNDLTKDPIVCKELKGFSTPISESGNKTEYDYEVSYDASSGKIQYKDSTGEFTQSNVRDGQGKHSIISVNTYGGNYKNYATGSDTIALGYSAQALNSRSVAIGAGTKSLGNAAFALGQNGIAYNSGSMTLGNGNKTYGAYSAAIGYQNTTGAIETNEDGTPKYFYKKPSALLPEEVIEGLSEGDEITDTSLLGKTNWSYKLKSTNSTDTDTTYSGWGSTAFGQYTIAGGSNSFAAGYKTQALGKNSVALGGLAEAGSQVTKALGYASFASGAGSEASGNYSFVHGYKSKGTQNGSIAFGSSCEVTGEWSFAGGNSCKATGNNSLAYGSECTASGYTSIALGNSCVATNQGSVAIGYDAEASGQNAVAFALATASGLNSFAWGNTANVSGTNSIALGDQAKVTNGTSIAIGSSAKVDTGTTHVGQLAVGYQTEAGAESVAVGRKAKATGNLACAFGRSSDASGSYAVALGSSCKATGTHSLSMGNNNTISGEKSIGVGTSLTQAVSGVDGRYNTLIGYNNTITSGKNNILLGDALSSQGTNTIILGSSNFTTHANTIVLGSGNSTTHQQQIILGKNISGNELIQMGNTLDGKKSLFTVDNLSSNTNEKLVQTLISNSSKLVWYQGSGYRPSAWSIPIGTHTFYLGLLPPGTSIYAKYRSIQNIKNIFAGTGAENSSTISFEGDPYSYLGSIGDTGNVTQASSGSSWLYIQDDGGCALKTPTEILVGGDTGYPASNLDPDIEYYLYNTKVLIDIKIVYPQDLNVALTPLTSYIGKVPQVTGRIIGSSAYIQIGSKTIKVSGTIYENVL